MNSTWRRLGIGAAGFSLVAAGVAGPAAAATRTGAPAKGAASANGAATRNGMQVTGAFLPQPASPSVASAYLTFHNGTGQADTLLSVTSSVASSSMAMAEGTDSMRMLGPVTIPAHGTVRFAPGHDHVMMQGLHRKLQVGQHVQVRLRFRHAGTLSLEIPVVPLGRILGDDGGASNGPAKASPAKGNPAKTSPAKGKGSGMGDMAGM